MTDRAAPERPLAVLIPGSPSPTSGSRRLAQRVLDGLAGRGWRTETIDLAALPADALLARREDPATREAVALAGSARVLVVATPMYRATYSGLLKCFFDLMPHEFLRDRACVLIATGTAPGHLLAIDHAMRPLVASLGGISVPTGVYAASAEIEGGAVPDHIAERLELAVAEADRLGRALTNSGG